LILNIVLQIYYKNRDFRIEVIKNIFFTPPWASY
jgi:hypothetical protein